MYGFHSRKYLSLVLVRRYSAHATALHAQDCPDWRLERTTVLVKGKNSTTYILICTGWTHLVELRCSSSKLFVSGCLGFEFPAIIGRYGAHASAFTRTILSRLVVGDLKPIFVI